MFKGLFYFLLIIFIAFFAVIFCSGPLFAVVETPSNLTANSYNPSNWEWLPDFTIDWDNSTTTFPIAWYKLGVAPTSDVDGQSTTTKPFNISATTTGQTTLYIWLEDNVGDKDYIQNATVALRYDPYPAVPVGLTADGSSPSPTKASSTFSIDWTNPGVSNNLIKMDGLTSVYCLGSDNKRYVFPNEATYNTWYNDFSNVRTISQSLLESYPLSANVTVKPGTKLIKKTSEAYIYGVEPGGVIVRIPDEATAQDLYGADWTQLIIDIPDAFFTNYTDGGILSAGPYPVGQILLATGTLYYFTGTSTGYREFSDYSALLANGYSLDDAIDVTGTMSITSAGTPITGLEDLADASETGNTSLRNIAKYWYKIGSPPTSGVDGTATTSKPFNINATESGGQTLYVWLEDNLGNKNYENYSSVILNYDIISIPYNILASPGDGSVELSWVPPKVSEYSVAGYNVYLATTTSDLGSFPINQSLISSTTYTVGSLVNNTKYYFLVTAKDTQANESSTSSAEIVFATPYAGPYYQLGQEDKFSPNSQAQYSPSVYNNKIVWEDYRNGNADIYMYDISQDSTSAVITNSSNQYSPVIYNSKIVWEDHRNNNADIYMYDIAAESTTQITSTSSNQNNPYIYDDKIVWEDYRNGNADVYMYNIDTGSTTEVTSASGDQLNPYIYDDKIVWEDYRNGNADIYMYDINTGSTTQVSSNISGQYTPTIYENKIVWDDRRSGNQDIYMYDLITSTTTQITYNISSQWGPKIYNNKIIWADSRYGYYDIYLYDLNSDNIYRATQISHGPSSQWQPNINFSSKWQPALHNDKIVWVDDRDGDNPNLYWRSLYTVPPSPISLTATGTGDNTIDWINPFDPPGIKGAWYKIGSSPSSDEDGTYTTNKPFTVTADDPDQYVYVWLENYDNYKDYTTATSVLLGYIPTTTPPMITHIVPGDSSAKIYWNTPPSPDYPIAGYNIFQALAPDGFGTSSINQTPVSGNSYTVNSLTNGTTYYYRLTTVDNRSIESAYSDRMYVTPYLGPYYQLGEITRISPSVYAQYHPAIYGNKIVWEDYRGGYSDIFMYDISADSTTQITANGSSQYIPSYSPAIYNNQIVWEENNSGNTDIYMYDIDSEVTTRITSNVSSQSNPVVYGNKIVWEDLRNGDSDMYEYDISNATSTQITSTSSNEYSPSIYGNYIAWEDHSSGNADIYMYNITSGSTTIIASGINSQRKPVINNNYIAWEETAAGDDNIFLYHDASSTTSQITYSLSSQWQPNINQSFQDYSNSDKVVWLDGRNNSPGVYMYEPITNNIHRVVYNLSAQWQPGNNLSAQWRPAIAGDKVVWVDQIGSGNTNIFMRSIYTVPPAPVGLSATNNNTNTINWDNPYDLAGIKGAWYKKGNAPTADEDGSYTTNKPFTIEATGNNQTLYVWLENNDGFKDYNNAASVSLNYQSPPSSSSGGGWSPRPITDSTEEVASTDGTTITTEIENIEESGKIIKTLLRATVSPSDQPINSHSIDLNTSSTSDIKEVSLNLSSLWLSEMVEKYGSGIELLVELSSQRATDAQRTDFARDGKYLLGFNTYTVSVSLEDENITDFTNFLVLSFDISEINTIDYDLEVQSFDESSGSWSVVGDGGVTTGSQCIINLKHLTDFGIFSNPKQSEQKTPPEAENISISEKRKRQYQQVIYESGVVFESGENLLRILEHVNRGIDIDAQKHSMEKYTKPLLNKNPGLLINKVYAINNFIVYGTKSTQILGAGERAGVVNSYRNAFDKLPVTQDEWRDCIAIGNGRWPGERSSEAEANAQDEFKTVYLRDANMENPNDNAAVTVMAYGLRPSDRSLDSEKAAIRIFKGIYKHTPVSAIDWDIVRAIAYSGAKR